MIDLDRLRRALVLGALGAAAMALLLPTLATLRYTDAHDWYAARKVSVAQALIFVGFDENARTDYRLADGWTATWLREGVATYPEARASRSLIGRVIGDNALLGACAGFLVVFALSGLLNLARHEAAGVSRAPPRRSPAVERRPGFIEDLPQYTPHGPDRVPTGAPPPPLAANPERAGPVDGPAGGTRSNVSIPSPEPPVEAEPEAAYEPPARPRGRWF